MSDAAKPICRDCKWTSSPGHVETYTECNNPQLVNLVTGAPMRITCTTARGNAAMCGPDGRWFEQATDVRNYYSEPPGTLS